MLKSQVNAGSAAIFAAAANAGQKGLAQWLTPPALAAACAALLPPVRRTVCDLTCGQGALVAAAARGHKGCHRLGLDVDAAALAAADLAFHPSPLTTHLAVAELTEAGALLAEVDWRGDLFALNPPWSLHLYRDRLAFLADSDVPAVADAFAQHDGRTPKECLDSTVATLLLALDRCTDQGEGFLIGYESTLQRLLLGPGAPHGAVAAHVWAHATVSGEEFGLRPLSPFTTHPSPLTTPADSIGIVWFARGHRGGPEDITAEFAELRRSEDPAAAGARLRWKRTGSELRPFHEHWEANLAKWDAVREELAARRDTDRARPFHLWLRPDGTIATQLSRFEDASAKVDKLDVHRLQMLDGARPLQLVVQREDRDRLRRVTGPDGWRVEPRLAAAVAAALAGYHAARAPLTPLPAIQRLGYLDEEDSLVCRKDLVVKLAQGSGPAGQPASRPAHLPACSAHFRAGQTYPLRSRTIPVSRQGTTIGLSGAEEEVLLEGAQLVFHVSCGGREVAFLDAGLRAPGHTLDGGNVTVDATLQELAGHFVIPEVPDVATLFPDRHQALLARLEELERVLNA